MVEGRVCAFWPGFDHNLHYEAKTNLISTWSLGIYDETTITIVPFCFRK